MADGTNQPLVARDLVYQVEAARLLDRVSLSAERGEFVGLVGPNGAGKTTLLRTVSGLLRSNEGSVWLEGQDIARLTAKEVARVLAMVPQLAPYTYGFTALEVVMMGRYPHMGRFQVEGAAEREAALDAMGHTRVEAFADREVTTLSGGERQRVFVARALAQQPRVLLLDEPTSNLDIQYQLQVMELVRKLTRSGLTAIAAMHDLSLVARFCDRLVLLHQGQVLAEGVPCEVLTPGNIEKAFAVRSLVYTDPLTNSLVVKVLSPAVDGAAPDKKSAVVHVIGGGGRGSRAMYMLKEAGFEVTVGVLGEGDSDYHTAQILGLHCPSHPSFAPIDLELHREHLKLIERAHCVVLADICFGDSNYQNLEAAAEAANLLLIEGEPMVARDYTGGRASKAYAQLRRRGRVTSDLALVDDVKLMLKEAVQLPVQESVESPQKK